MSSQTKADTIPASSRGQSTKKYPGYTLLRKLPDFNNAIGNTNCFDVQDAIKALGAAVIGPNGEILVVGFNAVVDPCQGGNGPLRTVTILPNGTSFVSTGFPASISYFHTVLTRYSLVPTGANDGTQNYLLNQEYNQYQNRITSAINTAATVTIATGSLSSILGIHMAASAGTATVVVSVSDDNSNFLQVDSIAAAAATDLQYTLATNALNGAAQAGTVAGTGASTVKLNPLAWRIIKIVIGAAGAGNTTTTDIGMK